MENQNNKPQNYENNREHIKKRKESLKFLKIYMFTLFMVVIVLISLSYFAQEKLNNQIEQLTIEANSNKEEAITHANSAEQLQKYLKEQENIIADHQSEIELYEEQLTNYSAKLDEVSANLSFYQEYILFNNFYEEQKYVECLDIAIELTENAAFIAALENENLSSEQSVITEEIIEDYYNIIAEIFSDEQILQQFTAEQIEKYQNLQNKG
ncbi:MAG: hypothetical protein R3Y09_06280 [Clostridia bacterium]